MPRQLGVELLLQVAATDLLHGGEVQARGTCGSAPPVPWVTVLDLLHEVHQLRHLAQAPSRSSTPRRLSAKSPANMAWK